MKRIIFIVSLIICTMGFSQNPFIYIKDGKFMKDCDVFKPMVMDYEVDIIKEYPSDTYHVSPVRAFCQWNYVCFTCGSNNAEWKAEMLEHFHAIQDSGFNAIRLMGFHLQAVLEEAYPQEIYSINHRNYYRQEYGGCYGTGSPKYQGEVLSPNNWHLQGDLLQEVLDVINNDASLDLKVMLLVGGAGYEVHYELIAEYLSYLSDRFKDEPTLWAYDLYNEPAVHDLNVWEPENKYMTSEVVGMWYDSIRSNNHSQQVTMGIYGYDAFKWDPGIMPLDFLSLHWYPDQYYDYPELGFNDMFENYKVKLWEFSRHYNDKLWIIGETGFGGTDDTSAHENAGSEIEQQNFVTLSLDYSGWYGAKGYSYFPYKEVHYFEDYLPRSYNNWVGLVYLRNDDQEYKRAGTEFVDYNITDICNGCTNPTDEHYYDPENWNNHEIEGHITNGESPVADAFIAGQKLMLVWDEILQDSVYKYLMFYTHSKPDGSYKLYTRPGDGYYTFIKATSPGYTLASTTTISPNVDLEIEPLDPNLLHPMPQIAPLVINSGEHIVFDHPISSDFLDISILADATLTITSELYLNHNSKITVFPEGTLIVDGGLITSSCGFWKGIEVMGTPLSSDPNDQGLLQVFNGGIIENAEVAVKNYKLPIFDEGGIIEADDAIFRNNEIALDLRETNNGCYFTNSSFVTNNDYPENQFDKFVILNDIDGIPFNNCTFENHNNVHVGYGIEASNSSFSVNGGSTLFQNLQYAIKVIGTGTTMPSTIKESTFTNNYRGIYISAINEMGVTNCTINIPPETPMILNGVPTHGLYMDECTGYTIEENVFDTYGSGDKGTVGLYIHESGIANNMVYNNVFNNLQNATVAYGLNRSSPFSMKNSGLCYKCNEFTNNNYDIVVNGSSANDGIMKIQGSSGSDPDDPAGNRFSWTGPEGTPTDINNQGGHFTYHHHVASPDYQLEPMYYSQSTVTLDPNQQALYNELSCLPSTNGGGGGSEGGDRGALQNQIADSETEAQTIQATLDLIVDGGNTEALENYVETSYPPESFDVYSDLMNKSPYLSNEVVDASIEKENVLPNVMIRDVMVANPQSAKENELVDKLEERTEPMPDYMLAQILQGRSLVGYMEELYSQKSHFEQKRALAFNSLLRVVIEDESITQEQRIDELIALFLNQNTIEAQYRLSMLYFAKEDYLSGQYILNNISSNFELSAEQVTALDYFNDFYQIMIDLNQSEEGLSEVQKTELQSIMQADDGLSGAYARNLLIAYDDMEFIEPVILPDLSKSAEAEQEYNDLMEALEDHHYLKLYPNPAKDHIIIEYELEMDPTAIGYDAQIMIYDNKGVLQQTIQANNISDKKVIDTRNLPAGLYFVSLLINNNEMDNIKFTIIK